MISHTPGPWRIGSKFEVGPRSYADDQSFGMIEPLADVYGDNRESDAKLISRSPEMYAALTRIAFRCQSFLTDDRPMLPASIEAILSICDSAMAE